MVLIRYCIEVFPEHSIHFVYGECSNRIPFIKDFLDRYHIPAKDLNKNFLFDLKFNLLNLISNKKIIILFPEGKLLLQMYKLKSLEYCKTYDIELNYLLCPHITGFNILKNYCDIILDTTILYSNKNNYVNLSNIYGNFSLSNLSNKVSYTSLKTSLFNMLPRSVHIYTRTLDKKSSIIKIWQDKDKLLEKIINNKYKKIPNIIINKNIHYYYFAIALIPITYLIYKYNL
jgi:hypothetical protein